MSRVSEAFNFAYHYATPWRPPVDVFDEMRTVTCACKTVFQTRSRNKFRCDQCQLLVGIKRQVKQNLQMKEKRKLRRELRITR